ncbi:hypothetical protein [Streptomyces alkaliterrae]|uniref:Uncharacterized protein n=1 Tax=Streptomyces alkaliterrae TaxID=2213162 RepID=A0A5P0YU07_9ACTN|nr:hypothetical protein [Streptomyces alkaliterrae]MBB1254792.1 hypothetical protein [Streptomyces alkaliterrae]MBB1261427.1 hypothetical protein [Streptomyces alkaliterrae]MQS03758.1 hypothetical protein [Streptomyces alkaliterrae]
MTGPADEPEQPRGPQCQFCHGVGQVPRAWAYGPGPDPFRVPLETLVRSGHCRFCRGTGVYEASLDPTLDELRRPPG